MHFGPGWWRYSPLLHLALAGVLAYWLFCLHAGSVAGNDEVKAEVLPRSTAGEPDRSKPVIRNPAKAMRRAMGLQ